MTYPNQPMPYQGAQSPQPGWYPDNYGVTRFWDGQRWTDHTKPPPQGPVPVQPNVRQARDRAQYTRPQTGHSLIKHILLGWVLLWIPTMYYAISPNHYFHA